MAQQRAMVAPLEDLGSIPSVSCSGSGLNPQHCWGRIHKKQSPNGWVVKERHTSRVWVPGGMTRWSAWLAHVQPWVPVLGR